MTAPDFLNWDGAVRQRLHTDLTQMGRGAQCAPAGGHRPPLRKRTRQVVSLRSGPMGHRALPGRRIWDSFPNSEIQALIFRGFCVQVSSTQGRRPGNRSMGTRACAPDGCNRVSPVRPPYQGVWGMGKENTRRSRGVFTRSPSPSDSRGELPRRGKRRRPGPLVSF